MEGGRIVQSGEPEQIVLNPASAYVRDFVAHMNPIKVLRGASLMTPLAALAVRDGLLQLDWTCHHRLALDAAGYPVQAWIEGTPARLVAYTPELDLAQTGQDGRAFVMVSPAMLLEQIIRVRQATGRPVLLCEGPRFVGVVGDDDIYRGMLRQGAARP